MKAVFIREPGDPGVLEFRDVADPIAGPGRIRVRVAATALNRADLSQRRGRYPAPPGWPPDIPGLEYAGVVDATGSGVTRWRIGDRVMGLVGGGACAEAVVVHEDEALPVPDSLTLEEAAAIPEAYITAHDAIVTQMALRSGEWILIHAVGSGVGTAALQIARSTGARTIGTSRSAWKLERCKAQGLDAAIDTSKTDFAAAVMEATGGHGADVVLDLAGGPLLKGNLESLAEKGRIVVVGLVAGSSCELDMRMLMRKRALIRGTTLRNRSLDEKIAATQAFGAFALPLLESRQLHPVIHAVMPMEEVRAAHEMLEAGENYGKIVLAW